MSDQPKQTPADNLARRLIDLTQGGYAVTVTVLQSKGEYILLSEKPLRVERLGRENLDIDKSQ